MCDKNKQERVVILTLMLSHNSDSTLHQHRNSKSFIKEKKSTASLSTATTNHSDKMIPERKKIVLVGDGASGKTCFLAYYSQKKFLEEYVPTVFENITMNATIQGVLYELALWDTSGQDDYARLRPVSYPDTDVFLVCFSVDNKTSFVNAETKVILINVVAGRNSSLLRGCADCASRRKMAVRILIWRLKLLQMLRFEINREISERRNALFYN
jgi:hypothetical protein